METIMLRQGVRFVAAIPLENNRVLRRVNVPTLLLRLSTFIVKLLSLLSMPAPPTA